MVQVLQDARNNVKESVTLGENASRGIPGKVRQINTAANKIQNVNITNLHIISSRRNYSSKKIYSNCWYTC